MEPEETTAPDQPAAPKRSLWRRIAGQWRAIAGWCSRFWKDVRPGPEARRGAAWGCIVAAIAGAVVGGIFIQTGFGLWADFLLCFVAAALLILISIALVPLLLTIFRKLPRLASGIITGCGVIIFAAGIILSPIVCLAAGVLGATIATILYGDFKRVTRRKKIVTIVLCVLALAANIGEVWFLAYDGSLEGMVKAPAKAATESMGPLHRLNPGADNPGEPGSYKTRVVYYGTKGGNQRRPEYDNPTVATPAVDASPFFKDFKGWKRSLRKTYWGYGMDKLPLNATVWIPEGPGPFPLALIVHGNHQMAEFSDPGYRYLGELMASRGFIFATIDENFLNSGLFHDPPKQQAVRGWMLLEHLKLWRDWSRDPNNPLHVAIDFSKIALMGHSRGGEAVATAVLFNQLTHYPDDARIRFDYHFPIQSIVAIAPADGQYKPAGQWRWIENVNYFTIQGANDADVSSFDGSRQFDHVRYTGSGEWFKSELYIYRANHGQFNTVWGRSDAGYPLGWFLNLKPLLAPEDQRRIAKVYLTAFMEATLHGRRDYLPLFRDPRSAKAWLPDTLYVNRYQDSAYTLLADFNEDADVTTTTASGGRLDATDLSIWREGRIPYRRGDRGYNCVFLGWNREDERDANLKPAYSITLPDQAASTWKLNGATALVLSLAALDEDAPRRDEKDSDKKDEKKNKAKDKMDREAPDFSVELTTVDGLTVAHPLSDFGIVLPPLKVRFTKLSMLDNFAYEKSSEPALQNISIPLSAFQGIDGAKLKTIRLRFDRTAASVILLSKIGFE